MSQTFNQTVMKDFVRRSQALGYKGKKRNDAAIDFLAGAIAALEALKANRGNQTVAELSNHLCAVTAMLIAPRGYAEVERMAEGVAA